MFYVFQIAATAWDDLESLGYMLAEFTIGKLPWQGLEINAKNVWDVIGQTKRATKLKDLCQGNGKKNKTK